MSVCIYKSYSEFVLSFSNNTYFFFDCAKRNWKREVNKS